MAMLLESGSDVDDQIQLGNDMRMDAAMEAGSMVCRMQAVEEIDEVPDLRAGTAGVLPPDGGVQQRLEAELESARLAHARQ